MALSKQSEHPTAGRECGTCVVCCVYPRIPELDKPGLIECSHLSHRLPIISNQHPPYTSGQGKNCEIYKDPDKPHCCKTYQCEWRKGYGREEDRPDKSFILFDRAKGVENALEAKALRAGAEDTVLGKHIINRMSEELDTPVIVICFGEKRVRRVVGKGL